MFTDIVGYTRLMGTSEAKALEVLQQNRAVQKPLITTFNGRFIKELGDGTMASFSKASDAVRCAMAMQEATKDHPDLNLRIGIHMGEVLFEDGDVFGDTVNIAARIESAGKPGAVFISGAVYGAVHNKTDVETRFVEQMQLKNVNRPIDIYEVAVDGDFQSKTTPKVEQPNTQTKVKKPALIGLALLIAVAAVWWFMFNNEGDSPKLEKASIAVLPFENMSADADNEFFCDGITEDLLTQLSKLKHLKVISRTSVMHFKNSGLSIPEIAKELNVEYVVEGSVRKQGDQVAITAQLIHARDDAHLWAENYQRQLNNVFTIQKEVSQEIAKVLNIEISLEERDGLKTVPTESIEASELYRKGRLAADDRSEEGLLKGIDYFKQAIEIDPLYVEPRGDLVTAINGLRLFHGYPIDSCLEQEKIYLDEGFAIDSFNYRLYDALGIYTQALTSQNETPIEYFRIATELNPNDPTSHHHLGVTLAWSGRYDEGLEEIKKALELDPKSEIINRNMVYRMSDAGQLEEAAKYAEENKGLIRNSKEYLNHLGGLYTSLGQWQKALDYIHEFDSLYPEWAGFYYETSAIQYLLVHDEEALLSALIYAVENNVKNQSAAFRYAQYCLRFDNYEAYESFAKSPLLNERLDSNQKLYLEASYYYAKRQFDEAEKRFNSLMPNTPNQYYCWTQLGREEEARAALQTDTTLSHYDKAFILASLNEIDSALFYFEKVDNWRDVAVSRFDADMKPLWSEPRYQAKVASYNFPPLVGDHVYNK